MTKRPSPKSTTAFALLLAILLPERDFLLIELKVFRPAHGASVQTEESTHYADDVRMSLVTSSGRQPFAFTSPTP